MKILGIDPGTATTGWGIINTEDGKMKAESCGCILTPAKQNQAKRLAYIYNDLDKIIKKTKPDVMAIERLFFVNNITTAMTVGEARGVCLLVAEQNNIPIFEYTPLQIKQGLTGYGKAEKKYQNQMIWQMLLPSRSLTVIIAVRHSLGKKSIEI